MSTTGTDAAAEPELTVDEHGVRSDGVVMELGVSFQRAGQVRQALAELRNNSGPDGNATRRAAAEKHLAELGYNPPKDAKDKDTADASASGGKTAVDARKQPPEGRSATPPTAVTTASMPGMSAATPKAGPAK